MKKKKILSLILLTLLTTSVFVGCSKPGTLNFKSEEVLSEFKNEVYRYSLGVPEKYTTNDFTDNLSNFLKTLNDDEKEEYLNYYVQGLYASASDLTEKMNLLGYELEDLISKEKITDYTYENFKLLPDEYGTIKGYVQEVEAKGFSITRSTSTDLLTITVNLDNIIENYGIYMGESLKKYYQLNNYENKNSFIADNTIDLEEVVNRILEIEEGINVDKNSGYKHIDKWMSSYEYYYGVLFGVGHEYFISSGYYKEDIVKKYEELAEKHKDKEIGKNLSSMVELLKANNNKNTTEVYNKSKEFINNKLSANDSEIQNAMDNLNGNMDVEDVAKKLGVSVDELLGNTEQTTESSENISTDETIKAEDRAETTESN